jgi:uncharacterized protein (TIGR00251 family)
MGGPLPFGLREEPGRVLLAIRVTPRARRETLTARDGRLLAHLRAAPVDGAANKALIALLVERAGIRRSEISIVRGLTSREKQIAIVGVSAATLHLRLDEE